MISDRKQESIAGLRAFADFLESNPSLPVLTDQRLLVPLHTNQAVQEFAAEHGLTVEYDEEGNAHTQLEFGPVMYYAYGYVDFREHCERDAEKRAREWAGRNGLELRPAEAVAS
jgi:hypothetical protein